MQKITISPSGDYFTRGKKDFFYLADTVWCAFTNTSYEEWADYLDYRAMQGYNVLQINVLAQWDRVKMEDSLLPFHLDGDGGFDFFQFNVDYFDKAEKMLEMAAQKGFIPALVLLWCDYVPDTWASKMLPGHVMPFEAIRNYIEYTMERFSKFNPIYLISGDTDLGSEHTTAYYMEALRTVKSLDSEAVTTLHLGGNPQDIHEDFVTCSDLDFYMYQSGHWDDQQYFSYTLAEQFNNKSVKRPVVNGEPCYEGGVGFNIKERSFTSFDVRKAIWQSLLSGGKAGVAYGASDVWNGDKNRWRDSLRLEGSWEGPYAKYIFEMYNLFDLNPTPLILNDNREIRMAATPNKDKVVIYSPFNTEIKVDMDLSGYQLELILLAEKKIVKPEFTLENNQGVIRTRVFNSDILIIGRIDA